MTTTRDRTGRCCTAIGRAAGVVLLGLVSACAGCQSTAQQPLHASTNNPPVATTASAGVLCPSSVGPVDPASGRTPAQPVADRTGAPSDGPASDECGGGVAQAGGKEGATGKLQPMPTPTSAVTTALFQPASDEPAAAGRNIAGHQTASSRLGDRASTAQLAAQEAAAKNNDKEDKSQRGEPSAQRDSDSYRVDRTLPSPMAGMITPVMPAPEKVQPITLGASLALAGVENPVIAIAEQAVRVSRAEYWRARALLLPNVNVGSSYDMHNGPLQGSVGVIRKVDRDAVYYGLGAYSVVAETVRIPGLWINTPLANAFYEPLVARQVIANRRFAATATSNQVLLDVSTAYLELLGAEGHLAVIRQSEADFQEIARLTASWARTGTGREPDANRARADLLALQYQEQRAQEDVAVAAADLARLLNLDPATRLQTGDVPIQVMQLVDPQEPLPKLLQIAVRNRPELMAAAAAIRASQARVRQERARPLLPLLWAGFSAGDFGGGAVASSGFIGTAGAATTVAAGAVLPSGHTTPKFGNVASRIDVDVLALWTLQNFGLGNFAHVKQRRAELNEAEAERVRILNEVERQVSEAYNTSAERFRSIGIELQRVQEATDGFQRDLERIVKAPETGRPIEVLDNAKRLAKARQALLAAVIGFDRAQFQLFVALGQPPTLAINEQTPPPSLVK